MMKRRFLCLALLLSIVLPLTAEDRVDMLLRHLRNPKSKRVLVVAHRGDWRNAPENSLQAFQN